MGVRLTLILLLNLLETPSLTVGLLPMPLALLPDDHCAREYVVRRPAFGVEERIEEAEAERREREHVDERAARALARRRDASLARVNGVQRAERHARRAARECERARVIEEHRRRGYPRHRAPHARVAPVAYRQLDCGRERRA